MEVATADSVGSVDLSILEKIHKALANRRRLAILRHLKCNPKTSVGVMAEIISLSFKSTSNHLGVLFAAGLVEREQASLNMYYRLAPHLPTTVKAVIDII